MSRVAVVAVIADVGWLVLISVGRMVRQRRRTGNNGLRLAAGRSAVARLGGGLFVGSIVAGLIGLFVAVAVAAGEADRSVAVAPVIASVVVAAMGGALTVWAQAAMGDSWRIGVDPTERPGLISGGPFRWVRNPIFTGMATVQVGLAMAVPNWWTVVAAAGFVAAMQMQVRGVEEPHLAVAVAGWNDYAARTGRFLPGLGTRSAS